MDEAKTKTIKVISYEVIPDHPRGLGVALNGYTLGRGIRKTTLYPDGGDWFVDIEYKERFLTEDMWDLLELKKPDDMPDFVMHVR